MTAHAAAVCQTGLKAVLGAAMERVRSDLFLRPGTRSVVLAHAFVAGGRASDSERDISVGGLKGDALLFERIQSGRYTVQLLVHGIELCGSFRLR